MSQHYFYTQHRGHPVAVVMGWDRPTGRFFLMVERPEPLPDHEDYVFFSEGEPSLQDLRAPDQQDGSAARAARRGQGMAREAA
jgi:hypothetical protein